MLQTGRLSLVFILLTQIGCRSAGYMGSPNNVFKKDAVVNMTDSSQKAGILTIALDNTAYPVNFVSLSVNGHEERIPIQNIRSYVLNNEVFLPRVVTLDYDGPERLLFVKRLTAENSRIQLYELTQEKIFRDDGQNLLLYFISLPQFSRFETWGLGNKNLVPFFNEKMSKIVSDCPKLANKIKTQEEGYYFSLITLSNQLKRDVLKRIIEEYNECK